MSHLNSKICIWILLLLEVGQLVVSAFNYTKLGDSDFGKIVSIEVELYKAQKGNATTTTLHSIIPASVITVGIYASIIFLSICLLMTLITYVVCKPPSYQADSEDIPEKSKTASAKPNAFNAAVEGAKASSSAKKKAKAKYSMTPGTVRIKSLSSKSKSTKARSSSAKKKAAVVVVAKSTISARPKSQVKSFGGPDKSTIKSVATATKSKVTSKAKVI